MLLITILPFTPFTATTGLSEMAKDNFKPAKADALTFIGSGARSAGRSSSRPFVTITQPTTLRP